LLSHKYTILNNISNMFINVTVADWQNRPKPNKLAALETETQKTTIHAHTTHAWTYIRNTCTIYYKVTKMQKS